MTQSRIRLCLTGTMMALICGCIEAPEQNEQADVDAQTSPAPNETLDAAVAPDAAQNEEADAELPAEEPEPSPWPNRIERRTVSVEPLDVLRLSLPEAVHRPAGTAWQYEWLTVRQPDGSTARAVEYFSDASAPQNGGPSDDTSTPEAMLFIDLNGGYQFELYAFQDTAPDIRVLLAQVIVMARPEAGIHVQLTWHTPADADETDAMGTDVDLHLLRPGGERWTNAADDCFYANTNPQWGGPDADDDPSLDIDDVNGAGPENISLTTGQAVDFGEAYQIGVHYFRDTVEEQAAPSVATVRVHLDGEPIYESQMALETADTFWRVGAIEWTESGWEVVPDDTLHDGIPD